ncbi:ChuX/HutX family heme-like substrate-binding protein [Congregibacter sp.]|uniref:ChuX/HutX family heme-like substrate-binding protein n=1 Tax=Congregibacter sp. TaxID=2744308 RepID=UPI003F6C6DD6
MLEARAAHSPEAPGDPLGTDMALPLLRQLPSLGPMTTVILHGSCVFEFKGAFPQGIESGGFYNLHGPTPGFHGHLRIDAMTRVRFQDRPHRGRASYAFVFENQKEEVLFKVFLGRDDEGTIYEEQLQFFHRLRHSRRLPLPVELTP